MVRFRAALALLLAVTGLSACSSQLGLAQGGPRSLQAATVDKTEEQPGSPPPARPEVPKAWVDALCDRVEDCAVERNTALAKESGGVDEDVEAARREAEQALVSGDVRTFCLLRVTRLGRADAGRIHGCLKSERDCAGFYRCADFAGAEARVRPRPQPAPSQGPRGAR